MKNQFIIPSIIIAALVLVGCGETDFSGKYSISGIDNKNYHFHLKKDGSVRLDGFSLSGVPDSYYGVGNWNVRKNRILMFLADNKNPEFLQEWEVNKHTFEVLSIKGANIETKNDIIGKILSKEVIEQNTILMVKCRACQKKVSSEAKVCPHCGQPDPFYPKK